MLIGVGKAKDVNEAKNMLEETIKSGAALAKLEEFVAAQGGDTSCIENVDRFQRTEFKEDIIATEDGYVSEILTDEIGMTSLLLGGGRETKESVIDLSVGLKIRKKIGDFVSKGESFVTLYANDIEKLRAASARVRGAYKFSAQKTEPSKHVLGIVTADEVKLF
jgi:pyrimidine-nucleoside phosphorylase